MGYYASTRFCPRCAWVRLRVKALPFQGFPGIFSSIDRYNKLVVHNHFDREGRAPAWLQGLGGAGEYVIPPHWSSFKALHEETGVTLRGEADGIFRLPGGSYAIVDYKTSRYTSAQQGMLRAYEVQLNAYAFIGERLGFSPVSRLALVYMEPATDEETAGRPGLVDEEGFSLGFRAKVVEVGLRPEKLPPLLTRARDIFRLEVPPTSRKGCKDCAAMVGLLAALGAGG